MAGAASSPTGAHLSLLKIGDGASPEVFTSIPYIQNEISIPNERNIVEENTLDSDDPFNFPGRKKVGPISFPILYAPGNTQHTALKAAFDAETLKHFEYHPKNAGIKFSFSGYVTGFSFSSSDEAANKVNVTIAVTTGLTYAVIP